MIKVAIVEDTETIRETVTLFINEAQDLELTGVYKSAEEALAAIPGASPDIVLMDIGLPGMNGIECIAKLKQQIPEIQFLVCTIFEDDENIFEALKSGATGYILKKSTPVEILNAIRDLHLGGSPMSSSIARRVISQFQSPGKSSVHEKLLTERENEILQLLSKGFRYKEISEKLNISFTTVRTHIHNIYEKLQVQSRTDAINKVYNPKRFHLF